MATLDEIGKRLTGKDVLFISSMAYAEMWTRKQRLATILAEMGNRVLYCEPAFPLYTSAGHKGSASSSLTEVKPNLFVMQPKGTLPAARFGFVRRMNLKRDISSIRTAMTKLGFTKPILFTYQPVIHAHTPFTDLLAELDYSLLVYDCVDEHSETIGYTPDAARAVHQWDLDLTARVDLAFMTAKGLYEERKHLNENIWWSPNGVDVRNFSKALSDDTVVPEDLAAIPQPRIGFLGALSDWIDYALIARIAREYPQHNVTLVGPLKRGLKPPELEGLNNVHLLGRKRPDQVPAYLKGFDVGLNPFQKVGIAEKVNPLKVYEYIAAGVPVVSVDMPEVMSLEGVIAIGRNDDEFVARVGDCISGAFVPDPEKTQEVLHRHNWEVIFAEFLEKVADRIA